MEKLFPGLLLLMFLLIPPFAEAENSTPANGFTIHHNALPVVTLSPEIAKNYGIIRSKYRGLLNVSVIKDIAGTTGQAVTARIEATSRNLIGKIQKIDMREVREGDAIYYLGEFPIVDQETLTFTLEVIPQGLSKPIKAQLSQQFFID